ncbi:MAG: 16S rRNA (cytidine(1402)-2'-O)-methyltransferase [Bacteroidales bacterium]|nr:16S rRNA (cytidine(1402)-2'-O)-methyltransferase [Bacteroidales bacterium]MDZ4205158.1 16S rRNA (cytidine(1402)-2'-O)-methyltransferase [Bacteroidales bacterium]
MPGKLFIVPTPIGNLEDITLRALRILKEADLVLAEDTRTSSVLLKHYNISKPMRAHHQHNEHRNVVALAKRIFDGENIALVSDAGTPGISDPGFLLVHECLQVGVEVECLPGPTAFIPALVVSGLPCDRFLFEGFLPQKKGRKTRLQELTKLNCTLVFYESPHRIVKTLSEFREFFGGHRKASVSREISKLFEETTRGTLDKLCEHLGLKSIRGEFVIIIEGSKG